MALSPRQRKIILMSMSFMYTRGDWFVELVEGDKEENKKAWAQLRKEIKELYGQLSEKFSK